MGGLPRSPGRHHRARLLPGRFHPHATFGWRPAPVSAPTVLDEADTARRTGRNGWPAGRPRPNQPGPAPSGPGRHRPV